MKTNQFHKDFQLNGKSFASANEIVENVKTFDSTLTNFLSNWFNTADHIVVKTSGSTGKSKEISLKKEYMKNSALATGKFFNLFEKTTALCCLPIDFIAGKMMLVRALTLGWHIDVIEATSYPLEDIEKEYDFCAMVPLQVSNSLSKLNLIKKLIVGGGVVSTSLEKELQSIETEVFATYGMTETITHIAVKPLNVISSGVERSCYQTLPNISISQDDRNCLVIDAPKVSDEIIITNDVVEIVSKEEFTWKGRFDNVINSGGIKLHPEVIEKKLSTFINSRFFVTGVPDEKLGEKLVLIVEGEENPVISNVVRNLNTLDKFETPKEVFFVNEFIETETKKIQRQMTLDLIFKK